MATKKKSDNTFSDQYKSPEWQKIRLQVLERDNFTCQNCGDTKSQLHVHHLKYESGKKVWEYPLSNFKTLCEDCHEKIHKYTNYISDIPFFLIRYDEFAVDMIIDFFSSLKKYNRSKIERFFCDLSILAESEYFEKYRLDTKLLTNLIAYENRDILERYKLEEGEEKIETTLKNIE